ncbi:MAG: CHRD domain-containing protein [bacterium]
MQNKLILALAAFVLVFTSCEKQENEIIKQEQQQLTSEMKSGNSGKNFTAHLSGDEEVPPVETNATGQAIFKLRSNGTELHYKLIVANIEDVFMSHIHLAPSGANGPVVAWLYPSAPPPVLIPGPYNGVLAEGVITSEDLVGPLAGMELSELLAKFNNGECYVNVHTLDFPSGEIRGQI